LQKELNEQQLKIKLNNAASHYYPSLEINGRAIYQSDMYQFQEFMPFPDLISKEQYAISLDFQQVIFDGMRAVYGKKHERLLNEAEIYKLDLSINTLKEKVISIYLNLLILDKQITLLSNARNSLDEQLARLNALLKAGVIYGNSVAQLEVEIMKLEQQAGELQATKSSLISSLSILTNKDLSNAVFTMPDEPEIKADCNSSRIEFELFQNQLDGLEYQRKLQLSSSLPKISIFATGGYGLPYYDIFRNNFDWFYRIGVTLKIPVIAWARTMGIGTVINLQKAIVSSHEADFEKFNHIAIQEKLNEISRIENLLLLDRQITEKYTSITNTSRTQLVNGTITVYDFIKQQNDELKSLSNQELHNIQLLKAKYELLALKGKL
jgi:outer membrane protein TolC